MTETYQHKTRPRQSSGYITGFTWEVAVANKHSHPNDIAEFIKNPTGENKIEFNVNTKYKPDLEKVLYGEYADYVILGRHQMVVGDEISFLPACHFILDVKQFREDFKDGRALPASDTLHRSATSSTRGDFEEEFFWPFDIQDMLMRDADCLMHTVSYLTSGDVCIFDDSQPDDLESDIDISKAENIIEAYLDSTVNYDCESNNKRIKTTIYQMITDEI